MILRLLFISSIFILSCSETETGSGSSRYDSEAKITSALANGELSIEDLDRSLQEREGQFISESLEQVKLEVINRELCERIKKMRDTCIGKMPISSEASIKQLNCEGEYENAQPNNKVEVDLYTNGDGVFQLKMNDTYISNDIGPGTTELKFDSLADTATIAPTFDSISKLEIIAIDLESPSGDEGSSVTIDILVGGSSLLSDTITDIKEENEPYSVRTHGIHQNLLSSDCIMSNEEMSALLTSIDEKVTISDNSDVSIDNTGKKTAKKTSSASSLSSQAKVQRLAYLENELTTLFPVLESARNRSFKLKNELLGGTGLGCHLNEPISSLSITFNATKTTESVASKSKSEKKSSGDAATLDIDLGSISYATKNFLGTVIPEQDFSGVKLGSINKINLTKMGIQYNNLDTNCSGGVSGFINNVTDGNKCYKINEEEVMSINAITLEVNGIILYQGGSLGVKLNRNKLEWGVTDLQSTPEWSQMLLRTDCNVNQ